MFRIGTGYDVHKFADSSQCVSYAEGIVLGGVRIPHEKALLAHSDGDVLLHAIMDAMLGAAALGDIGKHFPDSDDRYEGISSLELLDCTCTKLREAGYRVVNIDSTVIAQRPRISKYTDKMRKNIAEVLHLGTDRISVKATTEEGLGFTGRQEGIAAQAVCLIEGESDENI